jgi:ubiquinone/menaquinone biosynthesis C-methylase UbiE
MLVPHNSNVLDIGCGDGKFTHYLATLIPQGRILGIDPSASMLAAAKTHKKSNLSFVKGNAMKLPYKDKFDRIVAFNSLHWVSSTLIALKQIRKALKSGGQVLILVAPVQVRYHLHRIIDKVTKYKRWRPYFDKVPSVFSFHTLPEWAYFIERAGLIPEKLQYIDASLDYPNRKTFANSIASWIPFGRIPVNTRSKYLEDVVEAYLKIIPSEPNGIVHYCLDELVIVASKKRF